jgi:hypothetical protein
MFVPMIIWDSNELLFYTVPEMAQDDDEIIWIHVITLKVHMKFEEPEI